MPRRRRACRPAAPVGAGGRPPDVSPPVAGRPPPRPGRWASRRAGWRVRGAPRSGTAPASTPCAHRPRGRRLVPVGPPPARAGPVSSPATTARSPSPSHGGTAGSTVTARRRRGRPTGRGTRRSGARARAPGRSCRGRRPSADRCAPTAGRRGVRGGPCRRRAVCRGPRPCRAVRACAPRRRQRAAPTRPPSRARAATGSTGRRAPIMCANDQIARGAADILRERGRTAGAPGTRGRPRPAGGHRRAAPFRHRTAPCRLVIRGPTAPLT